MPPRLVLHIAGDTALDAERHSRAIEPSIGLEPSPCPACPVTSESSLRVELAGVVVEMYVRYLFSVLKDYMSESGYHSLVVTR